MTKKYINLCFYNPMENVRYEKNESMTVFAIN